MKLNYGEFDDFLNKKVKVMAKKLLVDDKGHVPMVLAVTKQGVRILNLAEQLSKVQELEKEYGKTAYYAGKDMIAKVIVDFINETNAYAYIHLSECWYTKSGKDEPIDIDVRHHKDREEALVFSWEYDAYGVYKTGMTMIPYYRDEDDSILILKEVVHDKNNPTATGRFTNILKPLA